jgi:hypothetical protein
MIGRLLSFFLLFLLASCSLANREILPDITPPDKPAQHCPDYFPAGSWQFVHAITFRLATGGAGTALGVVVLDRKEIRCALMTVEGLTLFEARSTEGQPVQVSRAVPPFDTEVFAAGLMGDVRTIFQKPPGKAEDGRLAGGAQVCRSTAAGQVTDILPQEDGCWTMHTYSEGVGVRTIRARSCKAMGTAIIPEDIDLVSSGQAGYTLNMHLISAEKLSAAN